MGAWSRWIRRLTYLLRRGREEQELDDELHFHVEMEARELVAQGVDPVEARRRALVAFGGVDRTRERVREARGVAGVDDFVRDVGVAVRSLRRAPTAAGFMLLVLALGIGATTAVFGIVHGVLLRPLDYPEPDRLVRVWQAAPVRGALRATFSVPDFEEWRDRSTSLSHLALYTTLAGPLVLTGDGPAEEVATAWIAGDFFGVFATPAIVGRTLDPAEYGRDDRVVVLSHDYWVRRFGADPALVGSTLTLDQQAFRVVGVMPPGFAAPGPDIEAWAWLSVVPQSSIPHEERFVRFMNGVGRLAPEVNVEQARDELTAVAASVATDFPDTNADLTAATVAPLRDVIVGDVRSALWILFGAVLFILLIVCATVAGLILARASARRGEMAVRMSLGAGRARLIRQLLTEAAVLGAIGGGLGLLLAWAGSAWVATSADALLPRSAEVRLDARVLGFALGLTSLTVVVFGLLPAVRVADLGVAGQLRAASRGGAGSGPTGVAARRWLVAGQVGVAVVLAVGAVMLVRSLGALRSVERGFDPEGVAALTLTIAQEKYPTREEYMVFYRRIVERAEALPGVEAVGSMRRLPTRGGGENWPFTVPGLYEPGPEDDPMVEIVHVGGEVFEALGTPVLAGRVFDRRDDATAPPRVVVNRTFVRRYMGAAAPVGRALAFGDTEFEIIGVVEDIRHEDPREDPIPVAYVHQEQNARIGMAILVRLAEGSDPAPVLGDLREIVTTLDPDQPISDLLPLEAAVAQSMARPRILTLLLGGFAALAALLAALGVYGVIATTVRQRIREVGLRMALGARSQDVVRMVVREGMAPALVGLGLGVAAAIALGRLMESVLFGVEPIDPAALVAGSALLALLAFVASALPARSASRIAPMEVLRSE